MYRFLFTYVLEKAEELPIPCAVFRGEDMDIKTHTYSGGNVFLSSSVDRKKLL